MSEYKHFSMSGDRRLFVCSETGEEGISHEFVVALDELREACGFPFIINSGYRSKLHSREKDKLVAGEHNRGAADIRCTSSWRRYQIIMEAMRLGFTGIGAAKTFVHVDCRTTTPKFWTYKD